MHMLISPATSISTNDPLCPLKANEHADDSSRGLAHRPLRWSSEPDPTRDRPAALWRRSGGELATSRRACHVRCPPRSQFGLMDCLSWVNVPRSSRWLRNHELIATPNAM